MITGMIKRKRRKPGAVLMEEDYRGDNNCSRLGLAL
jgi:hypothetical protein